MQRINIGTASVYLDFMITNSDGIPIILSFFERSSQMVRSVGANLVLEGRFYMEEDPCCNEDLFDVQYATITQGKERFTHGMAVATNVGKEYLITTENDQYKDLYAMLMNQYTLPLLEWWMPKLMDEFISHGSLNKIQSGGNVGNLLRTVKKDGRDVPLSELLIYSLDLEENVLVSMVSRLLKKKVIWITEVPQKHLEIQSMDDYFQIYGKSIVDNLKALLKPVSELNCKITRCTLKTMRLYPQQAAMVNGVFEFLKDKRRGSVLFCMGTGTGKTIQAAAVAEMLHVDRWLKKNPGKTLADAYEKDGIIHYRHIIMAPGHMVEKWKKEIKREIPYAKTVIIDTFKQLLEIKEGGRERRYGKEYYIISKDFLKLSYQKIPTPKKEGVRRVAFFKCGNCNTFLPDKLDECCQCKSKNIIIVYSIHKRHGLICPNCNRLIFKKKCLDIQEFGDIENISTWPLQWYDMAFENSNNQYCIYCGSELWMPFVRNINMAFGQETEPAWIRQTFWANKSKRGKVTNWVLRGHEADAKKLWGECVNSMENKTGGCRKYSPALYIKNQLKGFFDVFIMDEVHKAKGGSTAQGNAFHSLLKAASYTFGLTGTIAGGMATDLYYLLFRLYPSRMIEHGYKWGSVMKFALEYGAVETLYSVVENPRMNVMSKGRQLGTPRAIPGISPLVFSEFLLDHAVFLDISDMSEHMPPLYEKIELCGPENELERSMQSEYDCELKYLKKYEKEYKVNLSSIRNQFAMSYLDKPYGAEIIKDPRDGSVIIEPKDYSALIENGGVLGKEKRLLDIISKELEEGRRCVVYVEYSQSDATNVLPRLRELILDACHLKPHEAVVLYANYPSASKREEWMHKKAKGGMRVMLCNPRLCETGLDFCWKEEGVTYNYPTLIFYQCGYSLYITWQAAGRSWRLNQREECRTYYLAYEKTVQQAILQVLGEKKAATAAIQGRFSVEGLAAMAKGMNTQVRLAQIMSKMDMETGNRLQEMFDAITGEINESYAGTEQMKLFGELIQAVERMEQTGELKGALSGSIFELFARMSALGDADGMPVDKPVLLYNKSLMQFNELVDKTRKDDGLVNTEVKRKVGRRKRFQGTCSIL